jgi:hypothetical protein
MPSSSSFLFGEFRSLGDHPNSLSNDLFRNNMFELAHRLIGIYKTSNATRSEFWIALAPYDRTQTPLGITIDNHDLNSAPISAKA